MIKVCIVLGILWVCIYVSAIVNLVVNGCHAGVMGYPDEWENPKGEKINDVLATSMWIVTVMLMVISIILAITH